MSRTPFLVFAALVIAACESEPEVTPDPVLDGATAGQDTAGASASQEQVTVELRDTAGQSIGTAQLTQQSDGVQIAVHLMGGLEQGEHGFHVHETGSCEPPEFTSAGGHFAPHGRQHGMENPQGPHAGDLPNLRVGENGMADTTFVHTGITLRQGEPTSLLGGDGTALVVHAGPDDYRTDPSGDSGARVACGVIAQQ